MNIGEQSQNIAWNVVRNLTEKMPIEWEEDFVEALQRIQASKKTYWVQAKWIAIALFGYNLGEKEFRKNKTRVYRLGKRLEAKNMVQITKRRDKVGNSTGRSLIIYYHVNTDLPFFEKMKKWREK